MRESAIEEFLSYLAVDRQVAASTQNQAFAAILFLYEKVLEIKLERIDALRAQRKKRIPEVLSLAEVRELLNQIDRYPTREPFAFMLRLMYGTGMQTFRVAKYRAKKPKFRTVATSPDKMREAIGRPWKDDTGGVAAEASPS